MRALVFVGGTAVFSLCSLRPVLAHVEVTPPQANVAEEVVFTVDVPNEKEIATTGLRLVIPRDVTDVVPVSTPPWRITVQKDDNNNVKEINWMNGEIPAGQRGRFTFSAQVPSSSATIPWKTYQTYADGSVAAWDQVPGGSSKDSDDRGPYSETKILNDLAPRNFLLDLNERLAPYIADFAAILGCALLLWQYRRSRGAP